MGSALTRTARSRPAGPDSDDYILICVTPERIELVNDAAGVAPEPKGLKCVSLELRDGERMVEK